jgi:hypothetical protein
MCHLTIASTDPALLAMQPRMAAKHADEDLPISVQGMKNA